MQDLVLADYAVVIADDPELDLDTHARPKGCYCQSANLSADTIADHPHLPHFAMLPLEARTRTSLVRRPCCWLRGTRPRAAPRGGSRGAPVRLAASGAGPRDPLGRRDLQNARL